MITTHGIHHITAIAGDPQANLDFYVGTLGLRMVKRTVNFDDPGTYHFYFGTENGQPGTILTFFPWPGNVRTGSAGTGQVTTIAFSISSESIGFWTERLNTANIPFDGPFARFDDEIIRLHDPDGIELELVGTTAETRAGWSNGDIPAEHSIRGFFSATLSEEGYERTAGLLTGAMGFRRVTEQGNRFRYESGEGGPGTIIDLLCLPDGRPGRMGVGAVHHIAFRSPDADAQMQLRGRLVDLGRNVTPVLDRKYFQSIYFREPGMVLFEIATDPPGFTVDEPLSALGEKLMLPTWLEKERAELERILPNITIPTPGQTETA
jgi:glyoxalase family protein